MKFAETVQAIQYLSCWIEIQEFKSIPVSVYRRSKALHIYHKYIKIGKSALSEIIDFISRISS